MIVVFIEKMTDGIIRMINSRKINRKDFLCNLEPIYSNFETVNMNYSDSFNAYINLVSNNTPPLNPQHLTFRTIEQELFIVINCYL